jgi:hypothetical protein
MRLRICETFRRKLWLNAYFIRADGGSALFVRL